MKSPKTFVFIDASNIFYSQKKIGWDFDWQKINKYLLKNYNVKKILYYTGIKENDSKMQSLLNKLEKLNFSIFTKSLKKICSRNNQIIYKSNCDVEITVDTLLNQKYYDNLVLFSGDSDFVYVIKKLQRLYSKKIHIYSTRKAMSWEIKLSANQYFYLEDLRKTIEYKKTSAQRRSDVNKNNISKSNSKVK